MRPRCDKLNDDGIYLSRRPKRRMTSAKVVLAAATSWNKLLRVIVNVPVFSIPRFNSLKVFTISSTCKPHLSIVKLCLHSSDLFCTAFHFLSNSFQHQRLEGCHYHWHIPLNILCLCFILCMADTSQPLISYYKKLLLEKNSSVYINNSE